MSRWRARLAELRTSNASANSANSAYSFARGATGAFGTIGSGADAPSAPVIDPVAARAAFYRLAMADAAEALASPDSDLAAERAIMAEHYVVPASAARDTLENDQAQTSMANSHACLLYGTE